MITVRCEESGGSGEEAESRLKDPELRQRPLPARGVLLHQLRRDKGGEAELVCVVRHISG